MDNSNHSDEIKARNYRLNRNGNSAIVFSYVCNDEKIEELFASTLNEIAANVRCVSSINPKSPQLIAAHAN